MVIGTENGNTVLSSFLKKFQQKEILLEYVKECKKCKIYFKIKINVLYK